MANKVVRTSALAAALLVSSLTMALAQAGDGGAEGPTGGKRDVQHSTSGGTGAGPGPRN